MAAGGRVRNFSHRGGRLEGEANAGRTGQDAGILDGMDPKTDERRLRPWRLLGEINDMAKAEGWHLQICVDRQIVIAPDESAPTPRHDALAYVKSRADAGSLLHT